MRLLLACAALLGSFQLSEGCIDITKTTNLANGESSERTARGTDGANFGNYWDPPHVGCNLLPCGGDPLNSETSLAADRMAVSAGASKTNCTSTTECPKGEFCLGEGGIEMVDAAIGEGESAMGVCVNFIQVEGHIESTPAKNEATDENGEIIHQDEATDGTIEYHIKYGDNPAFLNSIGFEMVTAPHVTTSNTSRPLPYKQHLAFPDTVYAGNATIQVQHTTTRPDTKERVVFYQCIDIVIKDAPPIPEGNYSIGIGPDTKLPGMEDPAGTLPPGSNTEPTKQQGLDTFYIVLIVILALIFLVCICLFVRWMQNKNKAQKQKLGDQDGDFEPVVQQDVLPSEKGDSSRKDSKDSEDLSKRLESEENVAHIGYGDDEDSENTPTPDPSGGGTGSKGRHFHFRYVEEDPDADV